MSLLNNQLCPCGTDNVYARCCEPLHLGHSVAATPAQLMRARFSAYALKNARYVHDTYASDKQKDNPIKEISDFANSCRFVKLEVMNSAVDEHQNIGQVEFKAAYFYQNLYCVLHEQSTFIKEADQWRYLDGTIFPIADIKVSRNDNCPCGSKKKYKKCHSV